MTQLLSSVPTLSGSWQATKIQRASIELIQNGTNTACHYRKQMQAKGKKTLLFYHIKTFPFIRF